MIRAGKNEFPDVAVPSAVLAYQLGDKATARNWLTAIRNSGRTIQTYHMIGIYRQLYELVGFNDDEAEPDIEAIRSQITTFLDNTSAAP